MDQTHSSAPSHRTQQTAINLNNLLDRLTRNPIPRRRPRVRAHDDPALVPEGQRGGAVGDFDGAVGVRVVVGHGAQP